MKNTIAQKMIEGLITPVQAQAILNAISFNLATKNTSIVTLEDCAIWKDGEEAFIVLSGNLPSLEAQCLRFAQLEDFPTDNQSLFILQALIAPYQYHTNKDSFKVMNFDQAVKDTLSNASPRILKALLGDRDYDEFDKMLKEED